MNENEISSSLDGGEAKKNEVDWAVWMAHIRAPRAAHGALRAVVKLSSASTEAAHCSLGILVRTRWLVVAVFVCCLVNCLRINALETTVRKTNEHKRKINVRNAFSVLLNCLSCWFLLSRTVAQHHRTARTLIFILVWIVIRTVRCREV